MKTLASKLSIRLCRKNSASVLIFVPHAQYAAK